LTVVLEGASPKALDLIVKMLSLNPAKRISAKESLEHSYLVDLHRPQEEVDCTTFDLSFEFEKAIKTKFGVRHMMYDALISYQAKQRKTSTHTNKQAQKKW